MLPELLEHIGTDFQALALFTGYPTQAVYGVLGFGVADAKIYYRRGKWHQVTAVLLDQHVVISVELWFFAVLSLDVPLTCRDQTLQVE